MEASDWIAIGGWVVTFLLGIAATVVTQRWTAKRKVLAWTVLSESTLFPSEAAAALGVPIRIVVNELEQESLSLVNIRLGSGGNEVIDAFSLAIILNADSRILRVRLVTDLGEFGKRVRWVAVSGRLDVEFDYLNPDATKVDIELLIGGYEAGSASVDMSAPGVRLQRRDAARWDVDLPLAKSLALSIMGVRYDPTVTPLAEISKELRSLRQMVSRGSGKLTVEPKAGEGSAEACE